ncbi:hypothetical protein LCGC14_3152260, partial [marine sediment metagenome]
FQHAAFTSPLTVGDEVLILHPLLASLGTKATAAASGAVTTDDYAMAYIKQLVTLLLDGTIGLAQTVAWIRYFGDKLDDPSTGLTAIINTVVYYGNKLDSPTTGLEAIQNTIQAVAAYLASGTFGLGVLKALIETVDTVVDGIAAKLAGITLLNEWLGIIAGKQAGDATALTEMKATGAGSGTLDPTTDSVEALRDRGDAAWITATGFNTTVPDASGTAATLHGTTDGLIADVPTVSEFNARTLVAASYFDASTDEVITDAASRTASKATSVTVSDKTGFKLASDGLDQISAAEPTGKPTTFAGWVMWLVQRFRRSKLTEDTLTVEKEDGTAVTTQT